MWIVKEMNALGKWSVVAYHSEPTIERVGNNKVWQTEPVKVKPEHYTMSLDDLAARYLMTPEERADKVIAVMKDDGPLMLAVMRKLEVLFDGAECQEQG